MESCTARGNHLQWRLQEQRKAMKKQVKFQSGLKQSAEAAQQQQTESLVEFTSPEHLLRHDASSTAVPPRIEERLRESLAESAPPERPWWKKLLGG